MREQERERQDEERERDRGGTIRKTGKVREGESEKVRQREGGRERE